VTNPPGNIPGGNPADNPTNREGADDTHVIPPVDRSESESGPATGAPAAPGVRPVAWYRRLPGRPKIWLAALALVAACVIGCGGFIAGAVASHGVGEHGTSRDVRWGNDRQRGDHGRDNGREDGRHGQFGPGDERGPKQRRDRMTPAPAPSGTVAPTPTQTPTQTPAQPSTPSPTG
jgi:hypothetical protein